MKAIWNGEVIAESEDTIVVEGNHYFPRPSVREEFLVESDRHSVCPWKGQASYFTIEVDGERNENAAWTYLTPSAAAEELGGHIAFYRGVKVVKDEASARQGGLLGRLTARLAR